MLIEIYPSPTKPKPHYIIHQGNKLALIPNKSDELLANKLSITTEEVLRRNEIIKTLWRASSLFTNSMVKPKNKDRYEFWGELRITHFCSDIHDYKEEWPKDDNPFLISCWSKKQEKYMVCTTNFLELLSEDGGYC